MPSRPLVLASASPARLALLRAAGFDPIVQVSAFDETSVVRADPAELVAELARCKATAVLDRVPADALVIGCDSLLVLEGEVLGKPATAELARRTWRRMRGRSGILMTGHAVIDTAARPDEGAQEVAVASTTVHFGTPSDAELDAYISTGEPLQVAGGFTLDGRSAPFINGIDGDPGTVIGLSLPLLRALLARLDVQVTDLWR